MTLRRHQLELEKLTTLIQAGADIRKILMIVTPGGGKSVLPQIIARDLIPSVCDRIVWVTPRDSLANQGRDNFLEPRYRQLLGHNLEIRRSTNDIDPSRGLHGFTTTFQAVEEDNTSNSNSTLVDEFRRHRCWLIIDEVHHVEDNGSWHLALQPLMDLAAGVLLMTGTAERGNRQPVAWFDYIIGSNGRQVVNREESSGWRVISYGRPEALQERAILRVEFRFHDSDGPIHALDEKGQAIKQVLSQAKKDEVSKVLGAALDTAFARELLQRAAFDWIAYRRQHWWSKFLVVARNINDAKRSVRWLQEIGMDARKATSDDSAEAKENIRFFKRSNVQNGLACLVTVGMAYEGLDVREVTHVACLTHIRSKPWIEQMVARCVRPYDGHDAPPWRTQLGLVYVPDDQLMREVWDRIKAEQEEGLAGEGDWGPPPGERQIITGIEGHAADARAEVDERTYESHIAAPLNDLAKDFGLGSVDTVAEFANALGVDPMAWAAQRNAGPFSQAPGPEPDANAREDALRTLIEKRCRRADWGNSTTSNPQFPWGTHNRELISLFKKSRENMTEAELARVLEWMNQNWPDV